MAHVSYSPSSPPSFRIALLLSFATGRCHTFNILHFHYIRSPRRIIARKHGRARILGQTPTESNNLPRNTILPNNNTLRLHRSRGLLQDPTMSILAFHQAYHLNTLALTLKLPSHHLPPLPQRIHHRLHLNRECTCNPIPTHHTPTTNNLPSLSNLPTR